MFAVRVIVSDFARQICKDSLSEFFEEPAMKKSLVIMGTVLATTLLGGCANLTHFGIAPDRVEVVDYQKINLVERYARRNGSLVIWLNQPTRIIDRTANGS